MPKQSYKEIAKRKKARRIVMLANNKGEIKKPEYCQLCSQKGKMVGHHKDYEQPLELLWVCPKCHYHLHGQVYHKQSESNSKDHLKAIQNIGFN